MIHANDSRSAYLPAWTLSRTFGVSFALLSLSSCALLGGCAGQRYKERYQAEVDAMRAEYFELEDRYYETVGELESTQRRLDRALRASGRGGASIESEDSLDPSPETGRPEPAESPLPMPEDEDSTDSIPEADQTNLFPRRSLSNNSARRPSQPNAGRAQLPAPTNRSYNDPIETAQEREHRHASEAAGDGLPYFPAEPDERGLAVPRTVDRSLVSNEPAGPAALGTSRSPMELAWQEPSNLNPEVIDDWEVTRITIDMTKTRGYDSDGVIGDEGIMLVVHPRNDAGQSIPVFAPMKVSIIDPEAEGEAQRVGLWDFTAEELEYRQPPASATGQGIALRLPWSQGSPRHRRLIVFVRYESGGAQPLEVRQEVMVDIGSADRSAWSTRSTPLRSAEQSVREPSRVEEPRVPAPGSRVPTRQVSETTTPRTSRPAWSPHR